jgi:hypothetical protein
MNIIEKIKAKLSAKKISPEQLALENAEIEKIKQEIESIKAKAFEEGRYSIFNSSVAEDVFGKLSSLDNWESFFEMFNEWDRKCKLPYDIGVYLDNLSNQYSVYIHRTNLMIDKNKEGIPDNYGLNSIMTKGLENHGHANAAGGGAFLESLPDISLTMSSFDGFTGWINFVGSYKENDSIIIAAFPKECVTRDGINAKDANGNYTDEYYKYIYDTSGTVPHVKKDFIIGAVVKKNKDLWDFYSRDQIINNLYDKLNNNNVVEFNNEENYKKIV